MIGATMPRRTLKQWGRRRWLLCETAWIRWRMHLRRKSDLQRDWESGEPVRVARVEELAAKIRAEIEAAEDDKGVAVEHKSTAVVNPCQHCGVKRKWYQFPLCKACVRALNRKLWRT